ncbi:MAG TPA: 5-carboxymethyl-2-hydroxymuconate Delta-isomerase [Bauldia sp.]|nr:5-carboxymethyl-2-hydroxymuconate Delta-isomerase [Bauldia sp.]
MPHIIVEYSDNLERAMDIRRLIDDIHQSVVKSGLFDLAAIRTRAMPRSVYRIADGKPENAFIHVIARIRQGRSVEDRKRLGTMVLETAKAAVAKLPSPPPIGFTVEVIEMEEEMLFRHMTLKVA